MNRKGIRFSPEERAAMREAAAKQYASGASVPEIASALDCSQSTIRNLLFEAAVKPRPRNSAPLPEGMLTSEEAAALVGMGRAPFNTLHHRGEGPPRAERPAGAHAHYTYYWRHEVERWDRERAQRRLERAQQRIQNRAERRTAAHQSIVDYSLDWPALIQAVDAKRSDIGISWADVCRAAGVDQGHLSRLRGGLEAAGGFGTFARLAIWVCGYVPAEFKRFTRES